MVMKNGTSIQKTILYISNTKYSKLLVICCFFSIFSVTLYYKFSAIFSTSINLSNHQILQGSTLGILIETSVCKIPKTGIMPKVLETKWKPEPVNDCSYERIIGHISDTDEMYHLEPEFMVPSAECCFHEVNRHASSDNDYKITDCLPIKNMSKVDVKDKEMFYTKCGNYYMNFEANIPTLPKVQEKINYWKDIPLNSRPMNIIVFGIDTVSRSHAYRSLPKTLKYMTEEMGFTDFLGYHSIFHSTASAFRGFLMGMTEPMVVANCAPKRSTPYDRCPFIWKDLDLKKYVTMYIEDGEQTFNWGGQGGFTMKPTDYYIHALFTAMGRLRATYFHVNRVSKVSDRKAWCSSKETAPEFVLRYTKRYLKKFQNTPLFSFSWLAYPWHDYFYSLATFDEELLRFVSFLNSLEDLIDNSILVFLSDHGDRSSPFQSETIEGFIEKGLPVFFIRFPKRLIQKYPEMNLEEVLKINSQKLIGPLDLHHTFHHLLHLGDMESSTSNNGTTEEFQPVLADRTSLLVPVDDNNTRSCEQLRISPSVCLCGKFLNSDNNFKSNGSSQSLKKIVPLVQKGLNDLLTPEYAPICSLWSVKMSDVMSSTVMNIGNDTIDYLVQFKANPGNAQFEARVTEVLKNGVIDSILLKGEFSRINRYGEQSACVPFVTEQDKFMKQFCYCKSNFKL